MIVLSIDPGNVLSGFTFVDMATRRPLRVGKVENETAMMRVLTDPCEWPAAPDRVAIEMVASYGMTVGHEVFETCVWIGRFVQLCHEWVGAVPELVFRREVKLHHCANPRATDANVRQALVDRFALGQRNGGKGTKAEPGWFYGFKADIWQSYALGVYVADRVTGTRPDNGR